MTFPIDTVRAAFPSLSLTDNGRRRIYLDNPAGTQVPQSVVDAVSHTFIHANANLGGYFPTTIASEKVVDDAHAAMADFFGNGDPDEVIIGPSMTTLTLHLSRSICRDMQPGDEIIVTTMDHEGDVAPWLEIAADKGLKIVWAKFDEESWQIEPDHLQSLVTEKTKLVCLNYASNLTGSINRIADLAKVAKAAGALVYVDAVQSAPHLLTDVKALGVDFLVCSSYKFFGPHLGILWGRKALLEEMHAYKCRCSSAVPPGKFETGTSQVELLAGLTAAVDYFADLGGQLGESGNRRAKLARAFEASQAHETTLATVLLNGLSQIPGIKVIGITNSNRMADRVPTVSITHDTVKPVTFAKALADQGIFTWDGHNYAVGIVNQLGIPEDEGVLRIGIAHYNTAEEVEQVVAAVKGVVAA